MLRIRGLAYHGHAHESHLGRCSESAGCLGPRQRRLSLGGGHGRDSLLRRHARASHVVPTQAPFVGKRLRRVRKRG